MISSPLSSTFRPISAAAHKAINCCLRAFLHRREYVVAAAAPAPRVICHAYGNAASTHDGQEYATKSGRPARECLERVADAELGNQRRHKVSLADALLKLWQLVVLGLQEQLAKRCMILW